MIRFLSGPYRYAMVYSCVLALAFAFVLLDAFVIPKAQYRVESETQEPREEQILHSRLAEPDPVPEAPETEALPSEQTAVEPVMTDTSYEDARISIRIETKRKHDTTLYVADVRISDVTLLRTAFAQNTFGRNIKQTTSAMAGENDAIFAVNGDYYGFRDNGFVLRNGVLYRDTGAAQALVLDDDGSLHIVDESQAFALALLEEGAWQIWSFGPALVESGEVVVSEGSEVAERSGKSNPRTAIGEIEPLHYIFIVSDGRTDESAGLSLVQLAEELASRGCVTAYNLDGGGSSTMVFGGRVVNNPTNGRSAKERELSDIVYIGYEH